MANASLPLTNSTFKICSIDSCPKIAENGGRMCSMHRARLRRHGDAHQKYHRIDASREEVFLSCVEKTESCWIWKGSANKSDYGVFSFDGDRWLAHRFSWLLHYGSLPTMNLLHSCNRPSCVNVAHLREGTQKENGQDMIEAGHSTFGEKNRHAVLTDAQVLEIRSRFAAGASRQRLIADFQVSRRTIDRVVTNRTWRHLVK